MLVAFGWMKIQSSRLAYQSVNFEDLDNIDEAIDASEKVLFQEVKRWLNDNGNGWLKWQFSEALNNHSGLLQFYTSINHRRSGIWDLMDFVSTQSLGSYGAIYIHDDEDINRIDSLDFRSSYRIWRILDGKVTEHDDKLFSPFSSPNAFEC